MNDFRQRYLNILETYCAAYGRKNYPNVNELLHTRLTLRDFYSDVTVLRADTDKAEHILKQRPLLLQKQQRFLTLAHSIMDTDKTSELELDTLAKLYYADQEHLRLLVDITNSDDPTDDTPQEPRLLSSDSEQKYAPCDQDPAIDKEYDNHLCDDFDFLADEQQQKQLLPLGVCSSLRAVISSKPGSGKTTILRRLALACIDHDDALLYSLSFQFLLPEAPFPLLMNMPSLRRLKLEELEQLDMMDILYLSADFLPKSPANEPDEAAAHKALFTEMICQEAKEGHLLLLVDGWDEILHSKREQLLWEKLRDYLDRTPGASAVLSVREYFDTSRFAGTLYPFKLLPLSKDQIADHVHRWFSIVYRDSSPDLIRKKQNIIRELQDRLDSLPLAQTPLGLSVILSMSRQTGSIPYAEYMMYEQLARTFLDQRVVGLPDNDQLQLYNVIALHMAQMGKTSLTRDELVSCLTDRWRTGLSRFMATRIDPQKLPETIKQIAKQLMRGGFLVWNDRREATFAWNIQDYFTASALNSPLIFDPISILAAHFGDPAWKRATTMYAQMAAPRMLDVLCDRLMVYLNTHGLDAYYSWSDWLLALLTEPVYRPSLRTLSQVLNYLFAKQIAPTFIPAIKKMLDAPTDNTPFILDYIEQQFRDAYSNTHAPCGDFSFAMAAIEAIRQMKNGLDPLLQADRLITEGDDQSLAMGMSLYATFFWSIAKQIPFIETERVYRPVPQGVADKIISLLKDNYRHAGAAFIIHFDLLQRYASKDYFKMHIDQSPFLSIWHDPDILSTLIELVARGNSICESLLCLYPLFETIDFGIHAESLRARYMEQLGKNPVSVTAVLMCSLLCGWTEEERVHRLVRCFNAGQCDSTLQEYLVMCQEQRSVFFCSWRGRFYALTSKTISSSFTLKAMRLSLWRGVVDPTKWVLSRNLVEVSDGEKVIASPVQLMPEDLRPENIQSAINNHPIWHHDLRVALNDAYVYSCDHQKHYDLGFKYLSNLSGFTHFANVKDVCAQALNLSDDILSEQQCVTLTWLVQLGFISLWQLSDVQMKAVDSILNTYIKDDVN